MYDHQMYHKSMQNQSKPGDLPLVQFLSCGGTIATVPNEQGAVDQLSAQTLLDSVEQVHSLATFQTQDVLAKPSHIMNLEDIALVARTACQAAEIPGTTGVVVTHGTDIMEEVAFLTDLWHSGDVPIIFTGAQRNAASPDGDGPGNIRDAIRVATSPQARGLGAAVCFAGQVFPASRVRKSDTISLHAYDALGEVQGRVSSGEVRLSKRHDRPQAITPRKLSSDVYLLRLSAAAEDTLIRALIDRSARAVVVETFGAGTGPLEVVEALKEASQKGMLVTFVSRCERGGLWSQPGPGGYDDLVSAGAVPMDDIDGIKARIKLLALLGAYDNDREKVRDILIKTDQFLT
jgi:L-asparaginase